MYAWIITKDETETTGTTAWEDWDKYMAALATCTIAVLVGAVVGAI